MLKKFIIMTTVLMTLSLSVLAVESNEQPQTYKDKIPEFLSYLGERKEPIILKYKNYDYTSGFQPTLIEIDPIINDLKSSTVSIKNFVTDHNMNSIDTSFLYGFGNVYAIRITIPFNNSDMSPYLIDDLNSYLESNGWEVDCPASFVGTFINKIIKNFCSYKKGNHSIASWLNYSIYNHTFNVYLTDSSLIEEREKKIESLKDKDNINEEEKQNNFKNEILEVIRIN